MNYKKIIYRWLDIYTILGFTIPLVIALPIYLYTYHGNYHRLDERLNYVKNSDLTYRYGNKKSKVEILSISDYQCKGCLTVHDWVWPTIKKEIKKGNVVYYSTDAILPGHEAGVIAATYSYCVRGKDPASARELRNNIYEREVAKNDTQLVNKKINLLGKKTYRNNDYIDKCVKKYRHEVEKKVNNLLPVLSEMGIESIPAFFVNGNRIEITGNKRSTINELKSKITKHK